MAQLASQGVETNRLTRRFASLRHRLRFVTTFRGMSWVLAIVLFAAITGGVLDWRVHLPSVVRALILFGTLSSAGCVAYLSLIRPLWAKADDLTLA